MHHDKQRPLWYLDLAGIAACIAITAAWYMGGVAPLNKSRDARTALEADLAARTEQQRQLVSTKRKQEDHLKSLREKIEQAAIKLEPAEHINTRLMALTELARAHQLRLDEIRPGSPAALQHYTGVPIRLAGQGSYEQAARFLHAVHHSYRDVGVTGLDLRGEPEAADKPPTYVIQLLWYAEPRADAKK